MGVTAYWRIGDMRELDALLSPGKFDLVVSCMALDNILSDDELRQAVQSMHDVLKPTGRCYLRLRDFDHLRIPAVYFGENERPFRMKPNTDFG